ncbi:MAG: FAD-dependent oxidoreductase [Dehalococcoidia bacterium]
MGMGQAAGTAAAMAAQAGVTTREVSMTGLQDRLTAASAILDPAAATMAVT